MKSTLLLLVTILATGITSCTKITPQESFAPVITFSNFANNPVLLRPWLQHDTVVIGYPMQEYHVTFAAPNVLSEVSFSGPDTSGTIKEKFANETRFNHELHISVPCPDKTITALWTFKATDKAGKSAVRSIRVVYVDTFKIIPIAYNDGFGGFNLVDGKYVNPLTTSNQPMVDVQDKLTNKTKYNSIYLDYLKHSFQASTASGTLFARDTAVDFSDFTINKAYLASHFINGADSITNIGTGDVVICKLRGGSDFALLKIIKTYGSNAPGYLPNYYIVAYRKITE